MKHFNIFVLAASLAFASGTVSVQADVTRKEDVLNISSSKSVNNSENESDLEEILQGEMLHDRMLDMSLIPWQLTKVQRPRDSRKKTMRAIKSINLHKKAWKP